MERLATKEWNADWEKDVEPNFINAWKSEGEKRIIEVDNRRVGYFWFEQYSSAGHLISITFFY